jgi:hypothetical protein
MRRAKCGARWHIKGGMRSPPPRAGAPKAAGGRNEQQEGGEKKKVGGPGRAPRAGTDFHREEMTLNDADRCLRNMRERETTRKEYCRWQLDGNSNSNHEMSFIHLASAFTLIELLRDGTYPIKNLLTDLFPCSYQKSGCDLFVRPTQPCYMGPGYPPAVGLHNAGNEMIQGLKFICQHEMRESEVNPQFRCSTFHVFPPMDGVTI